MQKPNNYEETQVGGDYTPVELGGHTAIIKNVEEMTSRTGKPMIKVSFDFDKNDSQPEYFMQSFKADIRPDKKWPFQGTNYIMSEDQNGACSKSFKTFINCVEKSNNAECVWGDKFAAWFKNKKVGVVFGEVEEEYNGETKMRRRIRLFCQYDSAKTANVPDTKYLENTSNTSTSNGFVNVPDGSEDEIPF